jgi:hypothetical protein
LNLPLWLIETALDVANPDSDCPGPFTLESGRLTFTTGDPAMVQRLTAERARSEPSTVHLLSAEPVKDFTGFLETAELVKPERPQEWQVVMVEQKLQKRV